MGTAGAAGGAPRPAAIVRQSSVLPSGSHCTVSSPPPPPPPPRPPPPPPLLKAELSLTPGTRRSLAVTASPIHNSIPLAVVLVTANCLPSFDHSGIPMFALGGKARGVSLPSAIFLSASLMMRLELCGPLVLGLILEPANRSIGSANSAIDG